MFLSLALLSLVTLLPSPLAASAPTAVSSCTKTVHADPEVTWTTTRCAFCHPAETHVNNTLWVNYNGTFASNGSLFDSSYSKEKPWPGGDPFNFTLGAGQVISGYVIEDCPLALLRFGVTDFSFLSRIASTRDCMACVPARDGIWSFCRRLRMGRMARAMERFRRIRRWVCPSLCFPAAFSSLDEQELIIGFFFSIRH